MFATNSNFLIPMSLQPEGVNLLYFKLTTIFLTDFKVSIIKGLYDTGLQRSKDQKIRVWDKNSFPSFKKY